MKSLLSAVPLLGKARRGIFRHKSGFTIGRSMTYRVYVRWPGQRTSNKTVTPSKAVADAAWDELTSKSWPKGNTPLGLAYTHDGKQVEYIDLENKDDGQ